uniref:type IV secretion system protein VirB10 n=1 Tax=Marinobacterium profundum TaxID=1714300 RepID=UPI000ADC147D|nr:type IV secretion system protein VirB10 [Marinobacterium profundum]
MADNRDDLDQEDIDRGMPSINQRGPGKGGIGQKIIVGIGAIFVVLALVAVNGGFSSAEEDQARAATSNDEIGNRLGPAPALPAPPPPPEAPKKPEQPDIIRTAEVAPPPAPRYPTTTQRDKDAPPTPEERKVGSQLLAFGSVSRSGDDRQAMTAEERALQMAREQTRGSGGSMMGGGEAERADGLGAKLEPTQVDGARASLIADRNMFITKGKFLDCALETAISSDVPGMTSCRMTRDVYSTSGKVLLLERGSRIVGQYQSGLQRGQARIFVLWIRVETPTGVVVNLDSPGTDALGRSGHSGFIDTHFWERFGGAIMLSLIDDVGTWVANESAPSDGGNNQIQFGSTTEAAKNSAGIALENSINIPPTLIKHQGEHINVFVARDLDFRGVYDLRAE